MTLTHDLDSGLSSQGDFIRHWLKTSSGVISHISPSLIATFLLLPFLVLMHVIVGHFGGKKVWNLFHAPSSGNAMLRFSVSGREDSSRMSRGMAESSL